MPYRFISILALLVCVPFFPVAADPLTLAQAYELAVAQSEQLKITDAELRAAEARYRQASGGMWPEVNAVGAGAFRDNARTTDRENEEYWAGVGATWTIFQGFRTLRDTEARQAERESLAFNQVRYRELLYQDVSDVFHLVVAFNRELEVLAETAKALDERVQELERRVTLGRSRKAELLSSKTQSSDIRIDIVQVEGLRDAALELLSFLTGRPAGSMQPVVGGELPVASDIQRVLSGNGQRADVSAAERSAEAAMLDVKAESSDRNVTVEADGNVYVWRDPDEEGDWDLVIRAELPLFDGGIRRSSVAEKAADYEVRELRLAELRRIVDRDVRTATRQFESLLAQWAALQETIETSGENVATQRADYEIGRATNLDVLSALVQHYNLQRREATLEMQLRASLVRVEVAAGGTLP